MKIKRVRIRSYGPIGDIDIEPDSGFQIIYGPNEAGKTLMVDALIRLLSGLKHRGLIRIDEPPDGEITIVNKGKLVSITSRTKKPTSYLRLSDPHDLKNIYIIRNSDLGIDGETDLMKRLVGLESQRISKIEQRVRELGRVTEKKRDLSNQYENIKSRYQEAKRLIQDIDNYLRKAEKEGLDRLEIDVIRLQKEIMVLKQKIKNQEDARRVEDYNRLCLAWEEYQSADQKQKELEVFNPGNLSLITRYQREVEKNEMELNRIESDLKRMEEHQKELWREREILIPSLPEKETEDLLLRVREGLEKLPLPLPGQMLKMFPFLFIPLLALFTLFFFTKGFTTVTIGLGISGAVIGLGFLYGILRSAMIEMKKDRLVKLAESLGIRFEGGDNLLTTIYDFYDEIQKKVKRLNNVDAELNLIKDDINENQKRIYSLKKELNQSRERLKSEFCKLGITSLDDFAVRMEELNGVKSRWERSRQSLVDYFNVDDPISWEEGLRRMKDELRDIKEGYDRIEYERLQRSQKEIDLELKAKKDRLDDHRVRLKDLEQRASRLGIAQDLDPDWSVKTLDGLRRILVLLEDFVVKIDQDYDAALIALDVLDSITEEDENRISDIVGERFQASRYFSDITGGRYQKIHYDPVIKRFKVVQKDGVIKDLEMLSKGTFDQFYLAIRVAIAEGLKGGPKFMIMDDPFLASDRERLRTQFKILKGLVVRGWQIIYFTVKDEVQELAHRLFPSRPIELEVVP